MPLVLSEPNADTLPFLTTAFLKSSLSLFLASGRILALLFCDLAFGPSPREDTINALFAKANYAASFSVQICGSTFPVVGNWLTFLPAANACVEIPWFFTVLGALVWSVGVLCLVHLGLNLAWLLLRLVWLVVHFLLGCVGGCVGEFGLWAVGVLGGWLGMKEEEGEGEGREVPVVVVVDAK